MKTKTILAISESKAILNKISRSLNSNEFSVIEASGHKEIPDVIDKISPELAIFHVDNKEIFNTDFYKILKSNPDVTSIPVIFLIPDIDYIEFIVSIDHDAEDFLQLPLDPLLLKARIKAFFNKNEKIRQIYEEKMEKLRDNISSALPHEFRTSLAGILGFSEMIIKNISNKKILHKSEIDDIKDMASTIIDSGKHLNRLTENFLLYSEIQTFEDKPGKIKELKDVILHNSKEVIFDAAFSLSEEKKRTNDLIFNVENAFIKISHYYFHKLIYELIDNAVKFSVPGSRVNIKAKCSQNKYQIDISDSGRGMTLEQINSIGAYGQFDRFINDQQGAGLGLIIAKLIVIIHGGNFSINSKLGFGTNISISLPLIEEHPEVYQNGSEDHSKKILII